MICFIIFCNIFALDSYFYRQKHQASCGIWPMLILKELQFFLIAWKYFTQRHPFFFHCNSIVLKIHVIVLHFESMVNYAQSTKQLRDSAECTTNENVITRPYHFSQSSNLITQFHIPKSLLTLIYHANFHYLIQNNCVDSPKLC